MRNYSSLGNLHLPSSASSEKAFPRTRPVHSEYDSNDDFGHMPTPDDIQSHLFSAFLSGRTADVSLRVRASWEGTYKLHRVVLIQAGFFRSLFDGGFREAASRHGSGSQYGEVSITFDDPNITRAAFEVCLSRLYGGGPALFVDPRLIPSRREPLTPSFPRPLPRNDTPAGSHNATPRFLLSLLATATYLSIPSLVSQAIQAVLSSLGPHTVIRYLNFAVGRGIGDKGEDDAEAAAGLEELCQEVQVQVQVRHANASSASIRSKSIRSSTSKRSKKSGSVPNNPKEDDQHDAPAQKRPAPEPDDSPSSSDETDSDSLTTGGELVQNDPEADRGLVFMYGAASNKIGEAAACWLCRWGAEMLVYEEAVEDLVESEAPPPSSEQTQTSSGGRHRRGTESHVPGLGPPLLAGTPKEHVPRIWRRGGMEAKWARVVLSSDAFFVRDERERYDFAKRVVELRRKESVDLAEEREWDELFANGIHYMHMSLSDLIEISQDVSPTTGRVYTPPSVIQAAHWNQSVLRHHITYRQNSSSSSPTTPPRSPPARDGSLGLSQTTAEIRDRLSSHLHGAAVDAGKTYYPVPVDSSSRIGDTTGLEGASMDQLFNSQATPSSPSVKPGTTKGFTSYAPDTFFGILTTARDAAAVTAADPAGHASWSPFPPLRFGVEFWGIESLQEKARLTSQTIWYAGSLFNVYVQVVRKKGPLQLGMYLHRLSSVETIPIPSSPPMLVPPGAHAHAHEERRFSTVQPVNIPPASSSTPSLYRPGSRGTTSATIHPVPSRSTTPASSYSPPSTGSTGVSTSPPTTSSSSGIFSSPSHAYHQSATAGSPPRPPAQPYRDPREAVRAHFTMLCMSPAGGALTRFASAPDAFLVGRSWGWKSSALQTEELVDVHGEGESGSPTSPGGSTALLSKKECSLRATVILGVV